MKTRSTGLRYPFIAIFICIVFNLCAQETINYASLGGQVLDPSAAVVPGAEITARHIETNQITTATTSADGRFRMPYLRLGAYEVKTHRDGFADQVRFITLTIGSAFELSVTLALATAQSGDTVTADAEILETARTQIAGTVERQEIRNLPLNGRSFLDLSLLIPGVSPTNTGSNQLFAETSAVPGQGISVGSQRNFSNNFIVDGLSANDDAAGLSGIFYGLDVLDEFQVVTSGAQAEFGRALGGYVNVVTRSGTNTIHGDFYGYFRNQRFNAANALSHTVTPLTQAQYGASLGGPIVHDRTFYFANFEQRILNQSGLITISAANVAAINAKLTATGYPGPLIYTGLFPNPVHNTNFLAKVDHQFATQDRFTVRYSLYDVNSKNSRGAGGLGAVSASSALNDTDQTITAANVWTLSSRMVNETRGQFTRSDLHAPPSDLMGPAVNISGVASFGTLSVSPTARFNDLTEVTDNLAYQAGAHALRAGADFLLDRTTITYPRAFRGSYAFSSLANFLSGTYNNLGFTQTFNNSTVAQTNPNIGFYIQDEWKLNSRLTFNLGVRYDLQFLDTIATDKNNISPRAGFAWTPWKSSQTIIRGSYGLFYDRVPLRALANALLSAHNTTDVSQLSQISVSFSPGQTSAPAFPAILNSLAFPPGVLFNFTTMNRNMQNAYSEQGSFEIEHQVGARTSISAGYEHLRGLHLIASVNQNVPTCVASGANNGCRPNPNFANNSQYSSLGDSHYDGLHISLVEKPARWSAVRISYTYSKALDNVGEFFFSSPIDNFNIWQDYGRSDDDQRHRLVFNGSVYSPSSKAVNAWGHITHGFQLSAMLQYYSALPLNITTGTNTIQGTAARPSVNGAFIARNSGVGFDTFNLNARLSRGFALKEHLHLEAIAESFNLLNHTNGVTLNGTFGTGAYPANPSPSFGQMTVAADPRSFQLALRLGF
jgi:hypothetical protein